MSDKKIYTFLLRMTDTMTSQNTDLYYWDTLYSVADSNIIHRRDTQQSTSAVRDLNPVPPKYESQVLSIAQFVRRAEVEPWVRALRLTADTVSVARLANRGIKSTLCLL
jgi:hypothetical protein